MSDRNLLITILDTNPIFWGLQSNGLVKQGSNSASKLPNEFTFNDCLSAVVGFVNVYKTMNQNNAVVLIAAHNTKADYLYPSRLKLIDKNTSPWEKYEQIGDVDEQIKENLKKLANDQLNKMNTEENNKDNLSNDSMVTSALGLALCYINRIQQKYPFADSCNFRVLVIKASEDSSNQYMNFMNMIFSAEKMNVVIDSCTLVDDSNLLQQASSLTNGLYFKLTQINGLLHYLLWLYLPDVRTRKMLVYPPKIQVDYRAACFCHQKLIDVGYVCSVCLSVFCSFTPICTTCNTNFRFDVNMLKKASSLKQGLFVRQKSSSSQPSSQQQQQQQLNSQTSRMISLNEDSQGATNLAAQFQESTQINSPPDIDSMDAVTSPVTKIITTGMPSSSAASASHNRSSAKNFDDSFDMLE